MIIYSIIIPHKNTPELLQFCLDSIPVRDDVQVIVIDDNSSSDKVDFNHFPLWKGMHYEYYLTKEGKGTGYAQNIGLEYAKGKWVIFVGADDYLLPSISEILDDEKDTDADIIFFRPKAVLLNDRSSHSKRADAYNGIIDRFFDSGDETELRCRFFSVCSRFVRHDLIANNRIRFDEIKYSNDNLFSVKIGVKAEKIAVREKTFYCITESGFSLTSNFMNKPEELLIRADAFFRAQEVVLGFGYPFDEQFALFILRRLFSEDRKAFVVYFNRMRKMGYRKLWLLHELFRWNSRKAAIKRMAYSFIVTGI